jgi:hypothetical protein
MAELLENHLPVVKYHGLNTDKDCTFGGTVTFSGTTNLAAVSLTDLSTTGNTTLGNAVTDTTGINGATTITSTSASALTVGANGATNPVLKVVASTASVATGISLTGAAAAGGMAVAVVSSGTNENLTVDAKGSGTITLGGTSTGNIVLGRAMTGVSSSLTGGEVLKSGTAVPATAGAVAAGAPLTMFSSGPSIYVTSDAPTHTEVKGSICINTGGSSSSTRMYVNTDGGTTWTSFTTAA